MKLFFALCATVCLCATGVRAGTFLVLPFFNASDNANIAWIGDSVSETVSEALAKERLMIVERADRLEAYRRLGIRPDANLTRATVIKIGQALDAEQVIYGDFDLSGSRAGRGDYAGFAPHHGPRARFAPPPPGAGVR